MMIKTDDMMSVTWNVKMFLLLAVFVIPISLNSCSGGGSSGGDLGVDKEYLRDSYNNDPKGFKDKWGFD